MNRKILSFSLFTILVLAGFEGGIRAETARGVPPELPVPPVVALPLAPETTPTTQPIAPAPETAPTVPPVATLAEAPETTPATQPMVAVPQVIEKIVQKVVEKVVEKKIPFRWTDSRPLKVLAIVLGAGLLAGLIAGIFLGKSISAKKPNPES